MLMHEKTCAIPILLVPNLRPKTVKCLARVETSYLEFVEENVDRPYFLSFLDNCVIFRHHTVISKLTVGDL